MKKLHITNVVAALSVIALLSSCAANPTVTQTPFNNGQRFRYVLPKDATINDRAPMLKGLDFVYAEDKAIYKKELGVAGINPLAASNKSIFRIKSVSPDPAENILKVKSCIGSEFATGFHGNCDAYNLKVNRLEAKDSTIIELTPVMRWSTKRNSPLGIPYETPVFPPSELNEFLATPSVKVRYVIDSPYQKDAILANFRRALGFTVTPAAVKDIIVDHSREYGELVHARYKDDPASGRYVEIDAHSGGMVLLDVQPYRNGSKVTMTIAVLMWNVRPGTTIDLKSRVDQVKSKMYSIVTN